MDELVKAIVRQADIETEQARKIVNMVEAYEREHSSSLPDIRADANDAQRRNQDVLESLQGRGFLG